MKAFTHRSSNTRQRAALPEGWEKCRLGDHLVGKPKNGYSAREVDHHTGTSVLGLGCLTPDGFKPNHLKQVLPSSRSNAALLKAGDLLISRSNTRELVGLAGVYKDTGGPTTYPDLMMRLTPAGTTSGRYLEALLRSPELRRQIQAMATGTSGSMVKISSSIVQGLNVVIPPLPEQARITEVLDTLDDAIERTLLLLEKRRNIANGLVRRVFGQKRPGDALPPGWRVANIGDLCERITDGTHQAVQTSTEGVPFLFVSCIRDGRILWDQAARISIKTYESISPGRVPSAESVLYTAVGSYGHAAVVNTGRPFGFQRHIAILYPSQNQLMPSYLAEWFNSGEGRRIADQMAIGNAQKTVTLGALESFPIPIPSDVSAQKALIAPITAARDAIQQLEHELAKLRTIKSGLTSDLLTSRVRVPVGVSAC